MALLGSSCVGCSLDRSWIENTILLTGALPVAALTTRGATKTSGSRAAAVMTAVTRRWRIIQRPSADSGRRCFARLRPAILRPADDPADDRVRRTPAPLARIARAQPRGGGRTGARAGRGDGRRTAAVAGTVRVTGRARAGNGAAASGSPSSSR